MICISATTSHTHKHKVSLNKLTVDSNGLQPVVTYDKYETERKGF
jgi:hypothetical protein